MLKDNDVHSDSFVSDNKKDLQETFSECDLTSFSVMNSLKGSHGIYDPNSLEKICCIELINNNKIYIPYESEWTIRDLIKAVVMHKEFKKLYPNKEWQFDCQNFLSVFDLHLILYRSIKDETETKIDFNIKLKELNDLGLLKNFKFPFFVFKDNRNINNKVGENFSEDKNLKRLIRDNKESFLLYRHYLPRTQTLTIMKMYPELDEFYQSSKKGVNKLNRIFMDPLISEKENLDWFIYDDESLNFLFDMEKTEFTITEVVRPSSMNLNKIYFQDKYPNVLLPNKEYKSFYVVLNFSDMSMKVDCSLTHSSIDLLKRINTKLNKINPERCFDVKTKILKVSSLNDYVLDMEEPIGKFAYINDCIKKNKVPEYWIIDNPFINDHINIDDMASKFSNNLKHNSIYNINPAIHQEDVKRMELFSCNLQNELNNSILFKKLSTKKLAEVNSSTTEAINLNNSVNKEEKIVKPVENKFLKTSRIFEIGAHIPNEEKKVNTSDVVMHIKSLKSKNIGENSENRKDPITQYLIMINNIMNDGILEDEEKKEKILGRIYNSGGKIADHSESRIRSKGIKVSSFINETTHSTIMTNDKKSDSNLTKPKNSQGDLLSSKYPFDISVEKLIKEINDPILINQVNRPFSIDFRQLSLNKGIISSTDDKSESFLSLSIKIQIYCGSKPFSNPRIVKWKGPGHDFYIPIDKRIYFSLHYHNLPIFSSILFKIKHIKYKKNNEVFKAETIAWTNFRLFDHNRRLKTGKFY